MIDYSLKSDYVLYLTESIKLFHVHIDYSLARRSTTLFESLASIYFGSFAISAVTYLKNCKS